MSAKRILSIILAAAFLFAAGVMIYREWDGRQPVPILLEAEPSVTAESSSTETPSFTPEIAESETPEASEQDNNGTPSQPASAFGTITVCGKTFPVKKGVNERMLKGNIGWMESSAPFGGDGLCVLMGHRDRQFRILRKIAKGDVIVLTDSDGNKFEYTVQSAEIVESEAALRFPAGDGKRLMLVTCYPFVYQGHAPKKFVANCTITG